jgi:hypothetical protein
MNDVNRLTGTMPRQWIMSREFPRKYGEIDAMPAPPAIEPTPLGIEDGKTISLQPKDSPMTEAIENFEPALRERNSCRIAPPTTVVAHAHNYWSASS